MSTVTRLHPVPLLVLENTFPFALGSLYSGKSKGRYPWLTRKGPDGQDSQILWVIEAEFKKFAKAKRIRFELPESLGVEVMEGWEH